MEQQVPKRRITGNFAKRYLVGGLRDRDIPSGGSFIYVIQCGECGPVKIGIAGNPLWRLGGLQTGSWEELHIRALVGVIDGDSGAIERRAHGMASRKRIRGEWFSLEPLDAVACVLKAAHDLGHLVTNLSDAAALWEEAKAAQRRKDSDEYDAQRLAALRCKLGIEEGDLAA